MSAVIFLILFSSFPFSLLLIFSFKFSITNTQSCVLKRMREGERGEGEEEGQSGDKEAKEEQQG